MRNRLLILLLLLPLFITFGSPGHTQEEKSKEPATKLEAFLKKKGLLIVKDLYKLGSVGGVTINALVAYQPGQESQRLRGITIEVSEYLGERRWRSNTSFLDFEETQGLSKAIDYMIDLSEKWKDIDKEHTEVIFFTKGDFQIGFYQEGTKQKVLASSGYIAQTLSIKHLTSIKAFVDNGAELLKGK